MSGKHIFLKLEKITEGEVKLELDFKRDDEKNVYIMGAANTPDKNSAGFIVENSALLEAWLDCKKSGKNVAVYEKHSSPVGKMVACEEISNKVVVVLEIPKAGNERLLAVYEQGIYIGLSIGGWTLDGNWGDDDIFHVTEFEWYEVSLTDIPSNENALLLEYAKSKKPQQKPEVILEDEALKTLLQKVTENIKGI